MLTLNNPEYFDIDQLKQSNMWPFTFLPAYGMIPYINRMRGDIVGIEIGVLKGETSYVLLDSCPNIKKLYGIDRYLPYKDIDLDRTAEDMENYENIAKKNLKSFSDRFEFVKADSRDISDKFENESVDFILIDSEHTEENLMSELSLYYPKLKKAGIMFGHDSNIKVVSDTVKKFKSENKIRVPLQYSKNFIWFWIKS